MNTQQKKLALLSTIFHPASHTDVIASRWAHPFPSDAEFGWTLPQSKIVSMYVQQKTVVTDLSAAFKLRYNVREFDSIEGALTLGGDELAVDGIFLIGEHGDYPTNEFHQKLYPRKEFFDEIIKVFKKSNRVVPLFFDKHLSWNIEWIDEMYQQILDLNIPFFGGSSLPFSIDDNLKNIPENTQFDEIVAIYYNSLEAYFFHNAEGVECLLDQHATEPSKIDTITAWEGDGAWDALDRGEFSKELFESACAAVSDDALLAMQNHRKDRGSPVYAFQVKYSNGLKVTHFMQKDVIRKHCISGKVKNSSQLFSGAVDSRGADQYYPHFARFCRKIEDFFQSGKSPIPVHRLRTTSMTTAIAMHALANPGKPIAYPNFVPKNKN